MQRIRNIIISGGILMFAMTMSACDGYEKREQVDQTLWANDDSSQAYVKLGFLEAPALPGSGTTRKKEFRHQVWLQNPDGSGRQALTEIRLGQNGAVNYYMKTAGYVLLEVLESENVLRYDVIRLNGEIQTFATYSNINNHCASYQAIPAPDGRLIASIEQLGAATNLDCTNSQAKVTFFDAQTLAQVGQAFNWTFNGTLDAVFQPDGRLVVSESTGNSYALTTEGREETSLPKCFEPKTTSSNVSADGIFIGPGTLENPVEIYPVDATPFGCEL